MNNLPKGPIARTDWWLLIGFCWFLFFFGLAQFGLVGADEPRYAQVAREMFVRHDWVTPMLDGKPWLEKPIFYYWQAIVAYGVFGVSDWAARLPSAIDATLMVVAIYLFLRRFRPGFHLDGALMTAATAGTIGFARAASMDMPLTAMFTIAMLAWYAWYENASKFCLSLFYIFLGLGALAKGPVAPLLAVFILGAFAIAQGEVGILWRTFAAPGILLFCAVTLPWYVAVQIRNPEFFKVFILEHNFARFGSNLYHHAQPFWYYVPVALVGLAPWVVCLVAAAYAYGRAWWGERRTFLQADGAFSAFLLIWLVVPIVFFSISRSKLPGYIVPVLPAGTLLLAEYVRTKTADDERPSLVLAILHSLVAVSLLVPAVMIQYLVLLHRLPWTSTTAISAAIALLIACGAVLTLRSKLGFRALRFVTLVPVVLTVALVLKIGPPALDAALSARPLSNEISRMETKQLPLAVLQVKRETEYGLHFYRNQSISRYELGQVPDGEHIIVAPEGYRNRLASWVKGRRVSYLGDFPAQHVDYYWVAGTSAP